MGWISRQGLPLASWRKWGTWIIHQRHSISNTFINNSLNMIHSIRNTNWMAQNLRHFPRWTPQKKPSNFCVTWHDLMCDKVWVYDLTSVTLRQKNAERWTFCAVIWRDFQCFGSIDFLFRRIDWSLSCLIQLLKSFGLRIQKHSSALCLSWNPPWR